MTRIPLKTAALALVLGGCTGEGPAAPGEAPAFAGVAALSTIDLAGTWQWVREDRLTFPPFAAAFVFGVEPEGQRTVATCRSEGTAALSQAGTSLSGTEVTLASSCTTLGGQLFAVDHAAAITGEIVGAASVHMTFYGAVPCVMHAAARDITDGMANALAGGGRCIIPGHPRSEVPGFEPPPLGTEVITRWSAVRL